MSLWTRWPRRPSLVLQNGRLITINSERNHSFPSSELYSVGAKSRNLGGMFSWNLIKSNTTLEYHKWKTVMGNINFFHSLKVVLTNAKKKEMWYFDGTVWTCLPTKSWHSGHWILVTLLHKGSSTEEKITHWRTKCGSSTCQQGDLFFRFWLVTNASSKFYYSQETVTGCSAIWWKKCT